jgi:hypothetical protein
MLTLIAQPTAFNRESAPLFHVFKSISIKFSIATEHVKKFSLSLHHNREDKYEKVLNFSAVNGGKHEYNFTYTLIYFTYVMCRI